MLAISTADLRLRQKRPRLLWMQSRAAEMLAVHQIVESQTCDRMMEQQKDAADAVAKLVQDLH